MTIKHNSHNVSFDIPEIRDLTADCGAAAARAYGGRVIDYILTCGDDLAHHLIVINGRVVESYWVSWEAGKPVVTDSVVGRGEWAWGMQYRSRLNYQISSSMPLSLWMETINPNHPDHVKIH